MMQAVEIIDSESGEPGAVLTQNILDCACQEGLLLIKCGV